MACTRAGSHVIICVQRFSPSAVVRVPTKTGGPLANTSDEEGAIFTSMLALAGVEDAITSGWL
jgi:hypothetical protein